MKHCEILNIGKFCFLANFCFLGYFDSCMLWVSHKILSEKISEIV